MPCEECLTFAPGPDLSHLIAEKNRCMERAFAAEAALRAVLDLCFESEASNEEFDGFPDAYADTRQIRRVIAGHPGVVDA